MDKWIVTLEITVTAIDRSDALNVADKAMMMAGFDFLLYDATPAEQLSSNDIRFAIDEARINEREMQRGPRPGG